MTRRKFSVKCEKSFFVLLIFMGYFSITALINPYFAQEENALPPGPARYFGTVLLNNEPLVDALVVLMHLDGKKVKHTKYRTNESGRFTIYFHQWLNQPLIVVFDGSHIGAYFHADKIMPNSGINYRHTFHINRENKIKIANKKYRKLCRRFGRKQ